MLISGGIKIFDIGDFLIHDSINKKANVYTNNTNQHLECFFAVNILYALS